MNNWTFAGLVAVLGVSGWAAEVRIVCFGDSTTALRQNVIPYCDQIRRAGWETLNARGT